MAYAVGQHHENASAPADGADAKLVLQSCNEGLPEGQQKPVSRLPLGSCSSICHSHRKHPEMTRDTIAQLQIDILDQLTASDFNQESEPSCNDCMCISAGADRLQD